MTSIAYDPDTKTLYTMIGGLPHKLVTEVEEVEGGLKVTQRWERVSVKTLEVVLV